MATVDTDKGIIISKSGVVFPYVLHRVRKWNVGLRKHTNALTGKINIAAPDRQTYFTAEDFEHAKTMVDSLEHFYMSEQKISLRKNPKISKAKKNPKTQKQMFYGEQKKIADLNNLFMEMVQSKDITASELRALIKKRPTIYGRFENFIPLLEKNPLKKGRSLKVKKAGIVKKKKSTKKRTVKMITKNPKANNYPFHAKVWRVFLQKVAKGGHRLPQHFWWNGISFNSDKSMAIKYPNQKSAVAVAKSCQKRYSGKPVIFGVTDS